jgi:outer membrane protein assembly factor BamA
MRCALVALAVVALARVAQAQPQRAPEPPSCANVDTTPGAPLGLPPSPGQLATPIPWNDFVVAGTLVDDAATVHALLAPTLQQFRTNLSEQTFRAVAKTIAKFGYQLVDHPTIDTPNGPRLVLKLEPLPIVRQVNVSIPFRLADFTSKPLDEEIKRRMQVHVGSYLPSDPVRRQCALNEEQKRIEEFLFDEGYFDARVDIKPPALDRASAKLTVNVKLGDEYKLCDRQPAIAPPPGGEELAVSDAQMRKVFQHENFELAGLKLGTSRFTRTRHQEDLQKVRELFHKHGYPAARVQSSFNDPEGARTSFDRLKRCVNITLTIDPRRRVDIRFVGNNRDSSPDEWLRDQLTFDKAGSVDDAEATASARAIVDALQQRGMFDARVSWARERTDVVDILTFYVEQGKGRDVNAVEFAGNPKCNEGNDDQRERCKQTPLYKELNDRVLSELIATRAYNITSDVLGTARKATSQLLAADVDRIREHYRRAGFREAQVGVAASPGCPHDEDHPDCAVGDAALTAALVATGDGDNLYVRFTIDPGERTMLVGVELEPGDSDAQKQLANGLCDLMLGELASEMPDREAATLAKRTDAIRCTGKAAHLPFREEVVAGTRDRLRDFLFRQGRPRADLDYEARVVGPHRVEAHFKVRTVEPRTIGKVVIRGNFNTNEAIIRGELGLTEGQPLTTDALASAARRLRITGLFDAVNIDLPDLASDSPQVDAVVRVEERHHYLSRVELSGGYSSYNGWFGTLTWDQPNIWGRGASWQLSGTYGDKLQSVDTTFRLPQYLIKQWLPIAFQAELNGFIREQVTPRFGLLNTDGVTLATTRVQQYPRTDKRKRAKTLSYGLHYDYRLRTRNVDALRPIGADMDDTQVAISTRTGSVGATIVFDGRVDRGGQLSPLAAADGYYVAATASYASPIFYGQDTFAKVSFTASKFYSVGDNLVLRADARYDEGFPLGGAVLLPEVERYFAGGDNTVRGYNDDALATEIIQTGVPPLGGVSQIRVIPAGGNIRLLSSLDAQYRIYKIFAGALFTDAGMITNEWSTVTTDDIRPSVGAGLRVLTPFGIGALEYAVPLKPHLGDDPRGRIHFYFAARAQF